jgi:hypothetical protein
LTITTKKIVIIRKRNLISLFIILVVILTILSIPMNLKHASPIIEGKTNTLINDNTTSLHLSFTEKSFWLAISADFEKPTNVTVDSNQFLYSENNTQQIYAGFITYPAENNNIYCCSLFYPDPFCRQDFYSYYQVHLGPINISSYHPGITENYTEQCRKTDTFYELTGKYYYIFIGHADTSTMDLWINTTEKTMFSIKQGHETFSYERQDFFGNINIGWKDGIVLVNGMKSIQIHNTLFAWYIPRATTGYSLLRCLSPSHTLQWKFYVDYVYNRVFETGNIPHILDIYVIAGEKGIWTFKADIINFSIFTGTAPNMVLLGADVELPV